MSHFWHSIRYIKLYNRDNNEGNFKLFQTLQRNDNDFSGFNYHKKVL